MFHRVKSETEQQGQAEAQTFAEKPAEQKTEAVVEDNKKTEAQEKSSEENQSNAAEKQKPKTEDKDTKTMNQNAQDRQAQTGSFEKVTGTYQRPGQAPVQQAAAQNSGTQPSPYASSTYATSPSFTPATQSAPAAEREAPSASAAQTGERMLTIGRGITMSGEIDSCDYLLVEGTVEAALRGASVLDVSESGTFYGTVEIDEATVAGRFEGDITVNGRLTVRAGGIVTGSIAYGELQVESGAIIDGRLTPVSALQPAQANKTVSGKPSAKVEKNAAKETPEPANTDGELFSNSKTAS